MPSPITLLYNNITHTFQRPNGDENSDVIDAAKLGILDQTLFIDSEPDRPMGPKVVRPNEGVPYLCLQEAYLELLWSFSYGWMILYEEGFQRPLVEGKAQTGYIAIDTPLKARAAELLAWGTSLRSGHTPWPEHLPNPDGGATDIETEWCFKVNSVFQTAAAMCLYHEFAHVRLGHFNAHNLADTEAYRAEAIQLERDADDYAFHVFISQADGEQVRRLKAWAMLLPVLASFYTVNSLAGVFQNRHPHLHHRVHDTLGRLNFRDQATHDYFFFLCATVLSVFRRAHQDGDEGATLTPQLFDDPLDAFDDELRFLDENIHRT